MDLQQRNSRLFQRSRILDLGPEETLRNAKIMRKPLQQIVRHQKSPRANDGTKIHRAIRRGVSLKGRKGPKTKQEIQPGNERET
jgi:hypothetical protein